MNEQTSVKHTSIFTLSASLSQINTSKKKKILPEYRSSSQRSILSPFDSRNPGTIINMWPEAQTHWHSTDSQMRNREAPNPTHIRGLLTLSVESIQFQRRQQGREKAEFWLWKKQAGERVHIFPISKPLNIFTRASQSSHPQVDFATGKERFPKDRRHRSQNNLGQSAYSSCKTEGFREFLQADQLWVMTDWVPWAQEQPLGLGLTPKREMASVRAMAFRSRKHPKEGGLII